MTTNAKTILPAAADEEFINLVSEYVRGNLNEENTKLLLTHENLPRVRTALLVLKNQVETQLAQNNSRLAGMLAELHQVGDDGSEWIEYKADQADWRAKAVKFLNSIEIYLLRVKEMMHNENSVDTSPNFGYNKAGHPRKDYAVSDAAQRKYSEIIASKINSKTQQAR